jgi:hypothetical protein
LRQINNQRLRFTAQFSLRSPQAKLRAKPPRNQERQEVLIFFLALLVYWRLLAQCIRSSFEWADFLNCEKPCFGLIFLMIEPLREPRGTSSHCDSGNSARGWVSPIRA